jgi:hypothetical protein
MEYTAGVAGIAAAALVDPVFLVVWVFAGIFGASLLRTLIISSMASVALRTLLFVYFGFHYVALAGSSYLLLLYIITIIVGLFVSALTHVIRAKLVKSMN